MLSLAAVRWCYSKLMPFGLYFSSLERVAQCKFSMFTAKQPPTYRLHLCGDFQELILHLESHLLALKQRIRVGLWNKEDALVVFCVGECFMSVNKRGRGRERERNQMSELVIWWGFCTRFARRCVSSMQCESRCVSVLPQSSLSELWSLLSCLVWVSRTDQHWATDRSNCSFLKRERSRDNERVG